MTRLRSLLFQVAVGIGISMLAMSAAIADTSGVARAAAPKVSSMTASPITVYGAKWCSACRTLENGLKDRKIAFDVVDVDDSPSAFAKARAAAGTGGSIPLTGIVRSSDTVWVVGADVDAVDRAQRGD